MSFSSVRALLDACKAEGRPLYEVILRSDLAESGLTEAESRAAMRRLWGVMVKTSENYRGSDRSASGFAGGDAAKVEAAAAAGGAVQRRLLCAGHCRSAENRRVQRLHEAHRRRAHGGQLRRSARGAAAAVARRCG